MTTELYLEKNYDVCNDGRIALPDNKTWDDVRSLWVKWNHAEITFKDGTKAELDIDDDELSHEFSSVPV